MSRRNKKQTNTRQSKRGKEQEEYCFCRDPDDKGGLMVCCDRCDQWFHAECIGLLKKPPEDEPWFCEKCRNEAKQCATPSCRVEARDGSKYCSDECGKRYNKMRYEKFFRPKWERLAMRHSEARTDKMTELARLEHEKEEVLELIGKLKEEREELDKTIKVIKMQAKQLSDESKPTKDQDESESDLDEEEEGFSNDQTKTFCVICGIEQPADKAFKHWTMCHKKQEANFNFTSQELFPMGCDTDPKPNLLCEKKDKKTGRFCLQIASACPQHTNRNQDPNEICGCPHKVMQRLRADGNYCLKLKNNCLLHYNWDRFRLASKDMERLQAFQRFYTISDKIILVEGSLNDTYGGVLGVMLHSTVDAGKESTGDIEMIDDL